MKTTKVEYVQKGTKNVVVVHDVPVAHVLTDGSDTFSFETASRLDQLLDYGLASGLKRVELWFPKVTKSKKAA